MQQPRPSAATSIRGAPVGRGCFIGKMDQMCLGEEIEQIYRQHFGGAFPYEDCFHLARIANVSSGDLIPELDYYFGTIAGYSSSASKLHSRGKLQLQAAKKHLSVDFFQIYPNLECCRPFITPENTPRLLSYLQTAEQLRLKLLALLNHEE